MLIDYAGCTDEDTKGLNMIVSQNFPRYSCLNDDGDCMYR